MRTMAFLLLALAVWTTAAAGQDSFDQVKKDVQAAGKADDTIDDAEFKALGNRLLALPNKGRVGFEVLQWTFWLADITAAKPETVKEIRGKAMDKLLRLYPTTSMMPQVIEQLDEIRRPSDAEELPAHLMRIAEKADSNEIKALCTVTATGMKVAMVDRFGIAKTDAETANAELEKLAGSVGDLAHPKDKKPFKEIIAEMQAKLAAEKGFYLGTPAPEIEAADLDGTVFKLSDYRGKVVMLDFWGDW